MKTGLCVLFMLVGFLAACDSQVLCSEESSDESEVGGGGAGGAASSSVTSSGGAQWLRLEATSEIPEGERSQVTLPCPPQFPLVASGGCLGIGVAVLKSEKTSEQQVCEGQAEEQDRVMTVHVTCARVE